MSDEYNFGPRPKQWVYVDEFKTLQQRATLAEQERDRYKAAWEWVNKWGLQAYEYWQIPIEAVQQLRPLIPERHPQRNPRQRKSKLGKGSMITKDVRRIKQAKEVIEGQLSSINEILGDDERELSPMYHGLVTQSFVIIAMAVQSLTKD